MHARAKCPCTCAASPTATALPASQGFHGLYPVSARKQNELVRVVATRIERDGNHAAPHGGHRALQRRPPVGGSRRPRSAAPPPYRPIPGTPVYHVGLDDGTVVLVAEDDLCGLLLDLVTAVLAMGEAA